MFCPNCGNQAPDGVKFCPKCGKTMPGGVAAQSNGTGGGAASYSGPSAPKASPGNGKRILKAAIPAAVLILAVALIAVILGNRKTLPGVWKIGEISGAQVSVKGLDLSDAADSALNYALSELSDNNRFVFTKDGQLIIAASKSKQLLTMTYEKKDKETLTLYLSVSLPLVGEVSADYDCGYKFTDKDHLVLEIAGMKLTLEKEKKGKPEEYL